MDQQVEGKLVDVISGKIFPARMTFADGRITSIEEIASAPEQYILPGLVDAHIHIESSQLCPSRFAEMAVAHGTTSVVCDPHEIANVMGMKGIEYMVQDAEGVPLRFHFTAPSCVPATKFETNGATLGKEEVDALLKHKEFVALGEVMDYLGVIKGDQNILDKIKVARFYWKPVDGHCPDLKGKELVAYVNAGINSDHECTKADEAEEKYHLGMWIMAREGSGHKDLRPLLEFVKHHECFLVTDDLQAADLSEGHMDSLLRKAVLMGVDPVHAIRAATTWPSWHYFLPTGALQKGKVADFIIVEDLREFKVKQVYIEGVKVAEDGRPLFTARPVHLDNTLLPQDRSPAEFQIRAEGERASVRVIQVDPIQIESQELIASLPVRSGMLETDTGHDILLLAVVNRYQSAPVALGLIKGFGIRKGALASTVAHDSHNIIAVATSPELMAHVVNKVSRQGGYLVSDGEEERSVTLDVAGLMSTSPCNEVVEQEKEALRLLQSMGCKLPSPFTTLSFQSLLVVPELKLSDRGLFDTELSRFVDVLVRPSED